MLSLQLDRFWGQSASLLPYRMLVFNSEKHKSSKGIYGTKPFNDADHQLSSHDRSRYFSVGIKVCGLFSFDDIQHEGRVRLIALLASRLVIAQDDSYQTPLGLIDDFWINNQHGVQINSRNKWVPEYWRSSSIPFPHEFRKHMDTLINLRIENPHMT